MSNLFKAYAEFYNLFYANKDYLGESKYIHDLISENYSEATNILEFGCGGGGHAHELVKYGYSIHGVDISSEMLRLARAGISGNFEKLKFSTGDLRTINLAEEFDVVLSLFHVMGYQNSDGDVMNAYLNAHKHLKLGGLFIYDFWYGPTVLSDGPSNRILRIEDGDSEVIRIAQPCLDLESNLCKISYTIFAKKQEKSYKKITENHSVRYFFQSELKQFEFEKFELVKEYSWMSKNQLNLGDWYGVRVCKKI